MRAHARIVLAMGCALFCGSVLWAHEDVIDKMPGLDQPNAPLVGQGKNTSRDQAYAFWGQYDFNTTEIVDKPRGKRWMTVEEAIPWAKRVWNVNIIDETDDPKVGKVRFATGLGAVEREFALPLFLEAMGMAIEGACQDCYVEQDLPGGRQWNTADYHRGTVHIRSARPLQPDYDHPWDVDKHEIRAFEDAQDALPALSDHYCAPSGSRGLRCSECQAGVAKVLESFVAKGGVAAANSPACFLQIAKVCKDCRHCATYWESRELPNYQPIVIQGTGGRVDKAVVPEKK